MYSNFNPIVNEPSSVGLGHSGRCTARFQFHLAQPHEAFLRNLKWLRTDFSSSRSSRESRGEGAVGWRPLWRASLKVVLKRRPVAMSAVVRTPREAAGMA